MVQQAPNFNIRRRRICIQYVFIIIIITIFANYCFTKRAGHRALPPAAAELLTGASSKEKPVCNWSATNSVSGLVLSLFVKRSVSKRKEIHTVHPIQGASGSIRAPYFCGRSFTSVASDCAITSRCLNCATISSIWHNQQRERNNSWEDKLRNCHEAHNVITWDDVENEHRRQPDSLASMVLKVYQSLTRQ